MTTAPVQHQAPRQTPVIVVTNHSEQARRVAVLAIGVLASAVILAAIQPPASIILASVAMIATLSIAFDSGDHPLSESTTTERTVYVVKERPTPLWSIWNLPLRSSSERVPVGTEERNTFRDGRRDRQEMAYRTTTSKPTAENREPVGRREDSYVSRDDDHPKEPFALKENPFEQTKHTSTDRVPVGRR